MYIRKYLHWIMVYFTMYIAFRSCASSDISTIFVFYIVLSFFLFFIFSSSVHCLYKYFYCFGVFGGVTENRYDGLENILGAHVLPEKKKLYQQTNKTKHKKNKQVYDERCWVGCSFFFFFFFCPICFVFLVVTLPNRIQKTDYPFTLRPTDFITKKS